MLEVEIIFEDDLKSPIRIKKIGKQSTLLYSNVHSVMAQLYPKQTYCYLQYVKSPNLGNNKFHTKFRLRFLMSYESFVYFTQTASKSDVLINGNQGVS